MGGAASRVRANRRRRRPLSAVDPAAAISDVDDHSGRRRGPQAPEPHHLVPIRAAPGGASRPRPNLYVVSVLLESGHRAGHGLDLEHHIDPTRESFGAPPGVEYDLDHIARRVARGKLRKGGEEGGGVDRAGLYRGG
uniref:Uncharacterized protein n=1 Tax=Opuntia streptacantha TaxID=393608 RepID=A0A7C9AQ28_OPUST